MIAIKDPSRGDARDRPFQPRPFDAAYLDALRGGDRATERHFASYFGALVLLKLRRRVRSPQLVEDVRQETFLRVLRAVRSPDGLRDPAALGSFVNSVCNNVLRELLRRDSPARPGDDRLPAAPDRDPEDDLIGKETIALVRRIIRELPPRDQELLRALFVEEHERDEICRRFGVDRGYLRVLLHRAKAQFRARRERELP